MINQFRVSAAFFILAAGAASAASGGTEEGAVACATELVGVADGYTHVKRSVRRGENLEAFWLVRPDGTGEEVFCLYNSRRAEVAELTVVAEGTL